MSGPSSSHSKNVSLQKEQKRFRDRERRAAMTEDERAIIRERDRLRKRQRCALITDEEHALHLEQQRLQYRQRLERRKVAQTPPAEQSSQNNDVRCPPLNSNTRQPVLSASVSCPPDIPPPLTSEDINYVVQVLRIHANQEVSRIFGKKTDTLFTINSPNMSLDFDHLHPTQESVADIPSEDYIDTYDPLINDVDCVYEDQPTESKS
ncbi:hypothetical protein ACHQM5_011662 [Ranunculus cassubicifolius]